MSEDVQATVPGPTDSPLTIALAGLADKDATVEHVAAQLATAQASLAEANRVALEANRTREAALDRAGTALARAHEAERALQSFRQQVADKAAEIKKDMGRRWCDPGYEEAMRELDLWDLLSRTVTIEIHGFTVEIELEPGESEPNSDEVDEAAIGWIRSNLSYDGWEIIDN